MNNSNLKSGDEPTAPPESPVKPSSFCLFLGDLSYFCNENDLRKAFGPFGTITELRIIRNKVTKKSLCYGFIEYSNASSAGAAMREMNGKIVCGRAIRY
jgi:RNA recognition motif-containing protein